ncbi:hypothetical protein [Nocardioides daeguensis]|nr:hypothetical protein [Nocardioides daeguensis]MBV6729499.1 hypothetical protein [Nocardioides daeguensis]MCR1771728.1 hypothetical protein [Nocardioides daeguensis]
MRIPGRLSLVLVLLGSSGSGCALLDGSSRLEEALEYLPADATTVTFADHPTDPTDDWPAFLTDAGIDADDLEWEATGTRNGRLARVWKTTDDLDFDTVAADLVDTGHPRSGADDRPVFTTDTASFALVPDEHLVVSGDDLATLLDVVTDDTDSLADAGSFADLLDHSGDQDGLEYAALTLAVASGGGCDLAAAALFVPGDAPVRAVLLPEEGEPQVEEDFADRATAIEAFAQRTDPFGCPTPGA